MRKMFTKSNIPDYFLEKLSIYMFVAVLLGARLGHCLFYEFSYYINNPLEIILPFRISDGSWKFIGYQGLASHGAALGILFSVFLYSYKTKIPSFWIFDRLVIAICFAGASIRLGNLMNSEIYGHYTDLPWGFVFKRDFQTIASHPTQIYESFSYIALGILLYLMVMSKTKHFKQGFVFGVFLIGLFLSRFLIEYLKNSQEIWEETMTLNMGQWLSLPFIIAGIILIIITSKKDIGNKLDIKKLIQHKKK